MHSNTQMYKNPAVLARFGAVCWELKWAYLLLAHPVIEKLSAAGTLQVAIRNSTSAYCVVCTHLPRATNRDIFYTQKTLDLGVVVKLRGA